VLKFVSSFMVHHLTPAPPGDRLGAAYFAWGRRIVNRRFLPTPVTGA
jgi:hypothetical protein